MSHREKSNSYKKTNSIRNKKTKRDFDENIFNLIKQGNILMERESFEEASLIYARVINKQPKNSVALSNLGASLIKLGKISEATSILEYALELNPQDSNARINLGAIYQSKGDFSGALQNALEAVSLNPTSALAFNNLGCAFANINMLNEALHAYETAQILDKSSLESQLNIASTLSRMGRKKEALIKYEELIKATPDEKKSFKDLVKFFAGCLYLKIGNLTKGWSYYESGFNPSAPTGGARAPFRRFSFPKWEGEDLTGKRLLIWREQGLGDEIRFSTCLIDFLESKGEVTFECSERLVKTYSRSFPKFKVRPEVYDITNGEFIINDEFDYHIPIGSLPKILRSDISCFNKQKPFIKPNTEEVQLFESRLKPYRHKKIVGICWRSGKLDPTRNQEYTSLIDWKEILTLNDFIFVNLQYGECEEEIVEVENLFNVKIIRWQDLDLKNELDRVFSLISCLDCVISAPTAVETMSGALGVPTIYLASKASWVTLGTEIGIYPWFPNTISCEQPDNGFAAHALAIVPEILRTIFSNGISSAKKLAGRKN